MQRKSGKEIARGLIEGKIGADEIHEWLSTATAIELKEYLRWLGSVEPAWSAFGRDALNVLLANENIKLQKAIKTLTVWLFILTLIMVFLGVIQIRQNTGNGSKGLGVISPLPSPSYPSKPDATEQKTEKSENQNKANIKHKKAP